MFRLPRVSNPTDARHASHRAFTGLQVGRGRHSRRPHRGQGASMSLGLLGYKVGMTQMFTEAGAVEPVTVLQLGPCPVLQIRYPSTKEGDRDVEKDGYSAVQLGYLDKPRRNATRPEHGHVAANLKSKRQEARQKAGVKLPPKADVEPQRHIREFRLDKGGGFA